MAKTTTPRITPAKNWPIAKITPYEHNPRTHPAAQITLLAELIKKWGPDQDIVVDENGIILKGHGRRLAALEAGLKVYPVRQRFGLSEDDKTAMRIADNQVALLSGWDSDLVGFEVKRLERANYDMKLLGFGEAQLVQFTTTPGPPAGGFQAFDETIEIEHACPKCGYRWSGKSSPAPEEEKPKRERSVPARLKSAGRKDSAKSAAKKGK